MNRKILQISVDGTCDNIDLLIANNKLYIVIDSKCDGDTESGVGDLCQIILDKGNVEKIHQFIEEFLKQQVNEN